MDDKEEEYLERAAILEFDANLPRSKAEELARIMVYGPEQIPLFDEFI